MRALIIDDEPQIRRAVQNALAADFESVLEAGTGRAGIDLAAAQQPGLLVLDLALPDMAGIDVCREVRRWSAAPIIVLSARHSEPEKVALLDAGADDYITKPFSPAELRARVRLLLGRFDFVHTLRVLVNLIENAGKYSPPGAPIDVDGRRTGAAIVITVADRKPGVPEDERARVFQPYHRAAGSPADSGSAGLGLAIAAGLAQAQGGSLTLEPRPGGGSIFALTLPAADLPELPVPPP